MMANEQPNILFIQCDQMAAPVLPCYGGRVVRAPHIDRLAAEGVVFENAYCNSPLCAPSRFSMMAGQLPSRIAAYDNAAEFSAEHPTFAHGLRELGYATSLCGKMHFVGPDQLHGFEERLTTDIYPADFGWTPDWEQGEARQDYFHSMLSVVEAGPCARSMQLDFDDEVAFQATRKIFELARSDDERPFFLLTSFTHPHDPYIARQSFWDLYDHDEIAMPTVRPLSAAEADPHSNRLAHVIGADETEVSADQIRNARHAYLANCSYVDHWVAQIMNTVRHHRMAEDTIVIFTADHGDMLGERGLWFKMSFFEGSSRVPLMIAAPGLAARRVDAPVSTVDVTPTLADLAGVSLDEIMPWTDGESLLGLANGGQRNTPVAMEYAAEGSHAPLVSLRYGKWKYNRCLLDPEQLFDLEADPGEMCNLAGDAAHRETLETLRDQAGARWDLDAFEAEVRQSQARRLVVYQALRNGAYYPWDFQPLQKASERYMRNHMDLDALEENQRFPQGE